MPARVRPRRSWRSTCTWRSRTRSGTTITVSAAILSTRSRRTTTAIWRRQRASDGTGTRPLAANRGRRLSRSSQLPGLQLLCPGRDPAGVVCVPRPKLGPDCGHDAQHGRHLRPSRRCLPDGPDITPESNLPGLTLDILCFWRCPANGPATMPCAPAKNPNGFETSWRPGTVLNLPASGRSWQPSCCGS